MCFGKLVISRNDEIHGTYMYTFGKDTCIFFDVGDLVTESIFIEITKVRVLHTFRLGCLCG